MWIVLGYFYTLDLAEVQRTRVLCGSKNERERIQFNCCASTRLVRRAVGAGFGIVDVSQHEFVASSRLAVEPNWKFSTVLKCCSTAC